MNAQDDTLGVSHQAETPAQEEHPAAGEPHAAAGGGEPGEQNLFTELLHHTQDSRALEYPGGHLELPYILVERDGVHVYRSAGSLKESGLYTLTAKGAPVHAGTAAPPLVDMSVTKHVFFLLLSAFVLCIAVIGAARRNARRAVPVGFGNLVESVVVFIRDEIVIPNMGQGGVRYLPYLLTTFFFILIMNLLGLIPYGSTSTGNVNITAGLAAIAFVMIQASAIRAQGLGHYLAHLTGGVHWALWPIMIPIEILGLFTKPFALCIRLFANMTGGHIVIVSLIGLIFIFQSYVIAVAPVGFVVAIMFLEIFVAFLQAYIFTMLTSLFMGLGMETPRHGEHGPQAAG
jgi:F-type H+-transporting ATPase subunit a